MRKCILFVILEPYADWEVAYLSSAFQMLGQGMYKVRAVSLAKEPVCSTRDFCVLPDYNISSIPADYGVLILVGGIAWRNEEARRIQPLVEKCLEKGKVLGGICDTSEFLGIAGVLNSVNHTSNDLNGLKQWTGKTYTGEQKYVVRQAVGDGNIVTADGTAPLEFAEGVLFALKTTPEKVITEWHNFHKLGWHSMSMPEDATNWSERRA